ncbi:MAG: OmpA family protein [Marinilabiliales bacterium]
MKSVLISLVLIVLSVVLSAQNNNAVEYYNQARKLYYSMQYKEAASLLDMAIEKDKKYLSAYQLLANIYIELDDIEAVAGVYEKMVENCINEYPEGYFVLAETEYYLGNYEKAVGLYKKYLSLKNPDPRVKMLCEKSLKNCEFALNAIANPVPFNPKNLGENVNSEYNEYLPSISADESVLVITRKLPKKKIYNPLDTEQEDFLICYKDSSGWTKARLLSTSINTDRSEGAQTLSADGNYMFFTACDREDGKGNCDIYFTKKENGVWLKPINIGSPVNTPAYEGQPSISSDGTTLYFVSDRTGSMGGLDIYKTTISEGGKFSVPENLGIIINTKENEQSPFIHADGQTLYFSSSGHPGLGSSDLYVSHLNEAGEWSVPENLGYPINTSGYEMSLIVNAAGNKAYFASQRDSGFGGMDIYEFILHDDVRPVATTYFKGNVYDSETKKPLTAQFELIDLETNRLIQKSYSDPNNGSFLLCIPSGKNYALNVNKEGYLFFSESFMLKDSHDKMHPYIMDIGLKPIKAGETIVLKNVFFDTNKYNLKPESTAELNKLISFLKKYPELKIEIRGHTDNVGTDEDNQVLSENRAKAVYDYLVSNNIDGNRLSYNGYGEKLPVASNDTPEGRALNRRTEIKILE